MSHYIKPPPILICFAVKDEAHAFEQARKSRPRVKTLITGIGRANAENAIRRALQIVQPALVVSAGFAGGLNPQLTSETIVFSGGDTALENALLADGAISGKFHCAKQIVQTSAAKRALRESTGADAVEMESEAIGAVCEQSGIPFVTVRVILDAADEDLPLDFNELMTPAQDLSYFKLAGVLLKSPGKLSRLRKLQKQSQAASRALALALMKIIPV